MADEWVDVTDSKNIEPLIAKYFPPEAIDTAIRIAKAESSGDSSKSNINKNKTKDHGLFQINDVNIPQLKEAGIISDVNDLYNPDKNVEAASFLYSKQGVKPWSSSQKNWAKDEWIDVPNDEWIDVTSSSKNKPTPKGTGTKIVEKLTDNLVKRGQGISEEFKSPDSVVSAFTEAPGRAVRALGQVAGGIGDITTSSVEGIYKTIVPQEAQNVMKEGVNYWLNTPVGKIGLAALKSGGDVYEQFKKENPKTAKTLEGLANIGMLVPIGKTAKSGLTAVVPNNIPEKLYGSAVKMPLSKKWTQVLPNQEISDRTKAIRAGIKAKVLPTEQGLAKVTMLEKNTRGIVDDVIDNLTAQGNTIRRDDIIQGLDKAYAKAELSSDRATAKDVLNKLKDDFASRDEILTPRQVQDIKKQFYDEVNWGSPPPRGVAPQFTEMGKKGMANKMMTELEGLHPELKSLNQTDSAYIKLKEAIERATGRLGNKDIIGLGEEVAAAVGGAVGGVHGAAGGFAFKKILDMPNVKARLAFALSKSKKTSLINPAIVGASTVIKEQ